MTNTEMQIKNIVYEEFSKLIETIEGDFKANFVKKRYNFLLASIFILFRKHPKRNPLSRLGHNQMHILFCFFELHRLLRCNFL